MEKDGMNIQWYPGHMTKTRRMIAGQMKHMDAVCEILDARVPLQPEPGRGGADGGEAPAHGPQPGGSGGPGGDEGMGGVVPGKGLRRAGVQREAGAGDPAVPRRRAEPAGGQAGGLRGKGAGGADAPGDDPWHPKRGEVHLHQSGGEAEDREDGGPSRRHPCQTVGPGGPEP